MGSRPTPAKVFSIPLESAPLLLKIIFRISNHCAYSFTEKGLETRITIFQTIKYFPVGLNNCVRTGLYRLIP